MAKAQNLDHGADRAPEAAETGSPVITDVPVVPVVPAEEVRYVNLVHPASGEVCKTYDWVAPQLIAQGWTEAEK